VLAVLALLTPALGCASRGRPEPASPFRAEDRPFLVSPAEGYPLVISLRREQELGTIYRALVESGAVIEASREATRWLTADPGFHPATVLQAMVDFGAGDWQEAAARLEPVAGELPGYGAAQLLLGRTLERLERVPEAVAAYAAVADRQPAASAAVSRLGPRAAEILRARVEEALRRGRTDLAREALQQMEAWAPGTVATLEAQLAAGTALGEPETALAAARELASREPDDADLALRLATLELEVGDAGRGLRILEDLAARQPEDAVLAEELAEARFRWRLDLLPAHVRDLESRAVLTRADFAALVFWLFPSVRHGRAEGATIATDVLESPVRREIVRVVNLGLLSVDPELHLFHPQRAITRLEAMDGLLRLLRSQRPVTACAETQVASVASADPVCTAAQRCGWIPDAADCRAASELSGQEAMALLRHGTALIPEPAVPSP
jgi:tetratricopeptide (TPR) repeat protein